MLKYFKSKFHKKTEESLLQGDLIYNFMVCDFKDLDKVPHDAYDLMIKRQLHGIILRNVLEQTEIEQLLKKLENIPKEKKVFNDKNNLYPRGFSTYNYQSSGNKQIDFDTYFQNAKEYTDQFVVNFGIDIPERLKKIFEHIGSGRNFNLLSAPDNMGLFPHSQFRTLYPNMGLFPAHCENSHLTEFNHFFERLNSKAVVKDMMSYFFMLQKPDNGGEMILFDIFWEEGQKWIPVDKIQLSNGKIIDPIKDKNIKKMHLNLQAGDMLMFWGGPIWHKVTKVKGTKSRITLGGFFSVSSDNREIVCWA